MERFFSPNMTSTSYYCSQPTIPTRVKGGFDLQSHRNLDQNIAAVHLLEIKVEKGTKHYQTLQWDVKDVYCSADLKNWSWSR